MNTPTEDPTEQQPALPTAHPLRSSVGRLLHERPFIPVCTPSEITYLAWSEPASGGTPSADWILALCEIAGMPGPAKGAVYHFAQFESFSLRWERHTEFSSLALISEGIAKEAFSRHVYRYTPSGWLDKIPGELLVAVEITVGPKGRVFPAKSMVSASLCSSRVAGGQAQVWTDFRHHADGFSRFYIQDHGATKPAMGRLVQRLLEVEVYRTLALHGYETARSLSPRLNVIELELAALTDSLSGGVLGVDDSEDGSPVVPNPTESLGQLLKMSAAVERMAAETSFRFSATRAYARLVKERSEALKEIEIPGFSTLSEFIERRFQPAVRTCQAVEDRRQALSGHLGRAVNLLNIQVNALLEGQNRAQNIAIAQRSKRALHLQETVESLSIIAISYYAIGLLGYVFKAAAHAGLAIDPGVAKGVAVPVVVGVVWFAMRRIGRTK
jgi:uncharacterized membrane-anchored protein